MGWFKDLWKSKTVRNIVKIGGAIVITVGGYLAYLGQFKTVLFTKKEFKPRTVVYVDYQGGFC